MMYSNAINNPHKDKTPPTEPATTSALSELRITADQSEWYVLETFTSWISVCLIHDCCDQLLCYFLMGAMAH